MTKNNSSSLIEVEFQSGALGVTLRRRPEDGTVFIFEVIPDTQAAGMDVQVGDELWAVGPSVVGGTSLDKKAWQSLVEYIKTARRPLAMTWKRKPDWFDRESVYEVDEPEGEEQENEDDNDDRDEDNDEEEEEEEEEDVEASEIKDEDLISLSELRDLAKKIIFKDENATAFSNLVGRKSAQSVSDEMFEYLAQPGRKYIRSGTASLAQKGSLWGSQNKRTLFLFSDLLLITLSVGSMFQIDTAIDLHVCKIDALESNHLVDTANHSPKSHASSGAGVFDIMSPAGTVRLSCDEKKSWLDAIFEAICSCIDDSERVLGWRHQYKQGSVHAAVISRDEFKVRQILGIREAGKPYREIDAIDEDGYTPLHYACILRASGIVSALVEAGADPTVPDYRGLSSLHWSALQLDSEGLEALVETGVDVDVYDPQGRSPLLLACVEGRDLYGKSDPLALSNCLHCLVAHHADPNARDTQGTSAIHFLAASWQSQALKTLLQGATDIYVRAGPTGDDALHLALAAKSLRLGGGLASRILSATSTVSLFTGEEMPEDSRGKLDLMVEELIPSAGVSTLRTLLQYGLRPNSRNSVNMAPLHILAAHELGWGKYYIDAVCVLVEHGARLDDSAACALIKGKFADRDLDDLLQNAQDSWANKPDLDGAKCFVDLNTFQSPTLEEPDSSASVCFPQDGKDKCITCSIHFTMFRRQHHCRTCSILCCDECSKARVSIESSGKVRVCDACYNVVQKRLEQIKRDKAASKALGQGGKVKNSKGKQSRSADATDETQRKALFSGAQGDPQPSTARTKTSTGLGQTMSTMNEATERLHIRGEKLQKLNEKSAALDNAAGEFAKMAKQLNQKQKSSWF